MEMGNLVIIILSFLVLLQFIFNVIIIKNNNIIKKKNSSLIEEIDNLSSILPGDRIIFNSPLTWEGQSFNVLYEATVEEVSDKKLKVTAYEYERNNGIPSKLSPTSILNVFKEKWINKGDASLLISKDDSRQSKIDRILK